MKEHILNILSAENDFYDQVFILNAIEEVGTGGIVNFVPNGKALIEKLREQYEGRLPDILLLDLNIPMMDGLEVLKVLREREDFDDLPVIILTTSGNLKDIDQSPGLFEKAY